MTKKGGGNDKKEAVMTEIGRGNDITTVILEGTSIVILENTSIVIPNLIGDPVFTFFYFH